MSLFTQPSRARISGYFKRALPRRRATHACGKRAAYVWTSDVNQGFGSERNRPCVSWASCFITRRASDSPAAGKNKLKSNSLKANSPVSLISGCYSRTGSRRFSSSSRRRMMMMMMSGEEVLIPDDRAFSRFKHECQSDEGWSLTYNKSSICVWIQVLEEEKSLHKIKVSICDGQLLFCFMAGLAFVFFSRLKLFLKGWRIKLIKTFLFSELNHTLEIQEWGCCHILTMWKSVYWNFRENIREKSLCILCWVSYLILLWLI